MAPADVENGTAEQTMPLLDVPPEPALAEDPTHEVGLDGLVQQFGWLGWAGFGGPSAHVSLFQKVQRHRAMVLPSTVQ